MLNYQKTYRESLQKSKRKSTIKKPSINKSHASSINLKISQDLSTFDPMKISLRNNPSASNTHHIRNQQPNHSKSKVNIKHEMSNANLKYSFKIQNDQENIDVRSRIKTNYDNIVRPFQESNRCLITQRKQKPDIKMTDRSHSKGRLQLKTEYRQCEEYQRFYEKQQIQNEKLRKDMSTKHTNQSSNSNQFVKVSISQLTKLMEDYTMYKNNVAILQKQVQFYRKNSGGCKQGKNSVCLALGI